MRSSRSGSNTGRSIRGIECLDLVVQPGGKQIYCRRSPQTEIKESGYPGVETPFCGALGMPRSRNQIPRQELSEPKIWSADKVIQEG